MYGVLYTVCHSGSQTMVLVPFVALCLYFYLTLLTQRCKGNDTQPDKSQNHCTYSVQNVHCKCTSTLLFVHVMILTFFIKLFAYLVLL